MIEKLISSLFLNYTRDIKEECSFTMINSGYKSDSRLENLLYKVTIKDKQYILKIFYKDVISQKLLYDLHEFATYINNKEEIICAPINISNDTVLKFDDHFVEIYDYINNDYNDIYEMYYTGYGEISLNKMVTAIILLGKFHQYSKGFKKIVNSSINNYRMYNNDYLHTDKLFIQAINNIEILHSIEPENYKDFSFFNEEYYLKIKKLLLKYDLINIHGDMHFNNYIYKNGSSILILDIHSITFDYFYYDLSRLLYQCCFYNKKSEFTEFNYTLFTFLLNKYRKYVNDNLNELIIFYYFFCLMIIENTKEDKLDNFNLIYKFYNDHIKNNINIKEYIL